MGIQVCPVCGSAFSNSVCPKCPPPDLPTRAVAQESVNLLREGETFHNLEILGLLGRGGMGEVYKARQTSVDRIVALKVLPPGRARLAELESRFEREAKALASLAHPNIVTLFDFGEEAGLYYFTMAFIDGHTLRERMKRGPVPPTDTVRLLGPVLDALEYAHGRGVVHRDIKPENIMIDSDGRVRVTDFGLAKLAGAGEEMNLTRSTAGIGTMGYMAPEQISNSRDIDHRADLYSVGVVAYEMLTGQLPIGDGETPGLDSRLLEVLRRSMRRDPEQRFATAGEFRTALEAAIAPRRRTAPLALAAVLSAALLVVVLLWLTRKPRTADPIPPPPSRVRPTAAYEPHRKLVDQTPVVYFSIDVNPAGTMLVGASEHAKLRRWRLEDGSQINPILSGMARSGMCCEFSPDGSRIVWSGRDPKVLVLDAAIGEVVFELGGFERPTGCALFSPDGKLLATGSTNGLVRIWSMVDGKELRSFRAHEREIFCMDWHPGGGRILTSSVDLRIWDLEGNEQMRRPLRNDRALAAGFTPDGLRLVAAGKQYVQVWDFAEGRDVRHIPVEATVTSQAFRKDGVLATGDDSGSIRFYDIDTGEELAALFEAHGGPIRSMVFTPQGDRLVTSSDDMTIRVWKRK